MEIKKILFTQNDCYKANVKHKPKGIMWHSSGANNPNLSRYLAPDDGVIGVNKYKNHWNQGGVSKCVHAFIGKDKNGKVRTYQTLPWDVAGWHSGTGSLGSAKNANKSGYLGFETLEDDLKDGKYFNEVYEKGIELCVYLCKEFNLTENDIIGHYEGHARGIASNHADPKNWLSKYGKSMDMIRAEVKKRLETKGETPMSTSMHTVKSGESLSRIGALYGVDWQTIANDNGIKSPYTIHQGQKLKITLRTGGENLQKKLDDANAELAKKNAIIAQIKKIIG